MIDRYTLGAAGPVHNVQQQNHCYIMETINESARSGKTETLNEVLIRLGYLQPETPATQEDVLAAILTRIQLMQVSDSYHHYFLMGDDWDWLVVLQCLQANGLFTSHPNRPPFTEFERWLTEHHVPHYYAHYNARKLSNAHSRIGGALYPWTGVDLSPHMLLRWRDLYFNLDKMLKVISDHE